MMNMDRTAVTYPDDPSYWRRRALETHHLAEKMHSPAARGVMLDIALRYEALAKSSERRGRAAHQPGAGAGRIVRE